MFPARVWLEISVRLMTGGYIWCYLSSRLTGQTSRVRGESGVTVLLMAHAPPASCHDTWAGLVSLCVFGNELKGDQSTNHLVPQNMLNMVELGWHDPREMLSFSGPFSPLSKENAKLVWCRNERASSPSVLIQCLAPERPAPTSGLITVPIFTAARRADCLAIRHFSEEFSMVRDLAIQSPGGGLKVMP